MIGTHDTAGNLIANEQYYYKVYWGWDDKITTVPLFPTAMVTAHFGKDCFNLQGKWYHVEVNEQQVVKTPMPDFPEHPSIIEESPKGCLLRDEQFVYWYDRETLTTEKLKELTRGKPHLDAATIRAFIDTLDIPEDAKARLLEMTPASYTGKAEALARRI